MSQETTQQAEVTMPVKGTLTVALNHPTPKWAVWIVRVLVWISGGWIAMGWAGKLNDWGVPPDTVALMGKLMPIIAMGASIAARYLGIKPPDDEEPQSPSQAVDPQPESKPD